MKHALLGLLTSTMLLSACGGGGSDSNQAAASRPAGTVSGTSQLGLIQNGAVKLYEYTGCTKGALLASTTTDARGLYTLSLSHADGPMLLEVGFGTGYYLEEASLNTVQLQNASDGLRTVLNYVSGQSISASATAWSNAAVGLTTYLTSKGTACATAITQANTQISNVLGLDILTTTPKDITDSVYATATADPGILYGMHNAAISQWSYDVALTASPADTTQLKWNAIHFATQMHDDIAHDGKLDGLGTTGALSFNTTAITADVYRNGLAKAALKIADSANNKTGLNSAKVFDGIKVLNNSIDPIFAGVPVIPLALVPPSITNINVAGTPYTTPNHTWIATGIIGTITGTANSAIGISQVQYMVDGNLVLTSSNPSFSFPFASTNYTVGDHTVTLRALDNGGTNTDVLMPITILAAAPSVSIFKIIPNTLSPNVINNPFNLTTDYPGPSYWCYIGITYNSIGDAKLTSNHNLGLGYFPTNLPAGINMKTYVGLNVADTQSVTFTITDSYGFVSTHTQNVKYVDPNTNQFCVPQ